MTRESETCQTRVPKGAGKVLDDVDGALDHDEVSLSDLLQHLGPSSFTPLLMTPALMVVSPLSGVPGLSSVCGIAIALVSLQMLLGRDHVWLPGWLLRRKVGARRAHEALRWFRRPAAWLDRLTHQRLQLLVTPPLVALPRMVCVLSGGVMPLLELLPFTSSILGLVVLLNAVAFQVRDGLFALAGMAIFAALVSILLILLI